MEGPMKMPTKSHKFRKGEVYIRIMATYGFSGREAIAVFEKMEYNKKLSKKKKYYEVSEGDIVYYPVLRQADIHKFKDAVFRIVWTTDKRTDLVNGLLADIPKKIKAVKDKGVTDFSDLSKKLSECRAKYLQAGRDLSTCKKGAGVLDKTLKTCERTHGASQKAILKSCALIENAKKLRDDQTDRHVTALNDTKAELNRLLDGLIAFRAAMIWIDDEASDLADQTV